MSIFGGNEKASLTNLDTGGTISVQFNPKEFSYSDSADWKPKGNVDRPSLTYEKGSPASVKMDVYFDSTRSGGDVESGGVGALRKLLEQTVQENIDGKPISRPPYLRFAWGTFSMGCVVKDIQVQYMMFRPDGAPVRAKVTLSLMEHQPVGGLSSVLSGISLGGLVDLAQSALSMTRTVTVNAGQTLTGIASQVGQAFSDIARANNISDPLGIIAGQELVIPGSSELADAMEQAARSIVPTDWSDISDLNPFDDFVDDFSDGIAGLFDEGFDDLGASLNSVADAIGDVVDTVDNVLDRVDDTVDNIEDAVESVGDTVEQIGDTIQETVETVGDQIEETVDNVADRVEEAVENVGDQIEETVDNVADRVEEAVENVGDQIEETVDNVADRVEETVDTVSERVEEAVDNVADRAEEAVDNIADRAEEAVDNVADRAEEAVDNIADRVEEGVDNVADRAEEAVDNIADRVEEGVDNVADRVEEGVDNVVGRVEEGVDNVVDRVEDGVDNVVDRVEEGVDNAVDRVEEGIDGVRDRVGGVLGRVPGLGGGRGGNGGGNNDGGGGQVVTETVGEDPLPTDGPPDGGAPGADTGGDDRPGGGRPGGGRPGGGRPGRGGGRPGKGHTNPVAAGAQEVGPRGRGPDATGGVSGGDGPQSGTLQNDRVARGTTTARDLKRGGAGPSGTSAASQGLRATDATVDDAMEAVDADGEEPLESDKAPEVQSRRSIRRDND
jgi:ABC-type transporter Mla subunit MlaD